MASFGRLPSGVLAKGGGMWEGEGWLGGEGAGVVPYLHHAWLSRQYLSFGEVMKKKTECLVLFVKRKDHDICIVGTCVSSR